MGAGLSKNVACVMDVDGGKGETFGDRQTAARGPMGSVIAGSRRPFRGTEGVGRRSVKEFGRMGGRN